RIADLSPEKRELLLRHLSQKSGDASRSQIQPQPRVSNMMPLSSAQQRLWFLDQLEPGTALYNLPIALRLTGPLDVAALEQSLSEIVRRHEILRTTFIVVAGEPAQIVDPAPTLNLPVISVHAGASHDQRAAVTRLIDDEARCPFDLGRGPLFRTQLLRLDD